ncbi:putative DNA polymerase delta subunit 4-like protein [Tanacetum coccineum]|uniref:separase n=1 Tax=Tanacetum coccineum TaxID=301880 RepID=A0ABQ5HPV6_9ASTR
MVIDSMSFDSSMATTMQSKLGGKERRIFSITLVSLKLLPFLFISFEMELEAYVDMKDFNPKLFDVMEKKIRLGKSISLIQNAMESLKVKNMCDCEKFTSEAISIMLKLLEEREGDLYPLHSRLVEACSLRALCRQEEDPKSVNIMNDISRALMFWSQMPTLSKKDVNLLFHMFDLLTIKGNLKHHAQIYRIMLNYFDMKNADGLKDLCSILWKSRRLSHAICGSPVCGIFLDKLSGCCNWSDDVDTWKRGMEKIDAVGFEHKLTLTTHVPIDDSRGINGQDKVIRSFLDHSVFRNNSAAFKYVEECKQRRGHALHYAEEAFKMRTELLNKMFHIETQQEETVDDDDEKVSRRYNYQTFTMSPEVATTVWSHDEGSGDSQNFVLTPWNTLQCFLESSLQYGILDEDVDTAEKILVGGMNISSLQGLRLYSSRFSLALGKFYTKQHKWDLAVKKIYEAEQIWIDVKSDIFCLECNTIFEISINHAYGDVWLESKSNTPKGMNVTLSFYQYAEEKLNSSMWENNFSCPNEGSARTMFCCASGISYGPVAKNQACCWHCQQSRITETRSLKYVIYMQRECIRRSILIRLLANIGKCHRVRGDNSNEQKVLFERLSLFVKRSMPKRYNFLVTKKFIIENIDKRLSGFAYTIDYATCIYETCCFFLRGTRKKDPIFIRKLVRGLKISFSLSRQVPTLHREVSRLLAILYYVDKEPTDGNGPSAQQWAAYFHQSSIGTYFNNSLIARLGNIQGQNPILDIIEEDLEECVLNFFKNLPAVPIVCFSMLGDDSLLPSNLLTHSSTSVWIQLSRLNSEDVPIVDIIPIKSPLKDTVDLGYIIPETKWRNVTIDKVASVFNSVIEEKRFLIKQLDTMKADKWLKKMETLDQAVSRLLQNVTIDKVASVFNSVIEEKRFLIKQLDTMKADKWLKKMETLDQAVSRLLQTMETEWFSNHKEVILGYLTGKTSAPLRSPVILVLDVEIQVIPWESMPFMRLEDTYRMPCVMSNFSTLERSSHLIKDNAIFPAVDPRKLYYVLNPEGNLEESEEKLLPVFKAKRFEGQVREFPTPEKLNEVLTTNDIFIYSGHGTDLDYTSTDKIRELDHCSSLLLMACSSGRLVLNGSHNPKGLILDYIISGSPSIASNLWPIRGEDACIMIESMVNDWTQKGTYKTMGLSVAMARQKCKLPFIEGAGLVCYGVPTRVKAVKIQRNSILEKKMYTAVLILDLMPKDDGSSAVAKAPLELHVWSSAVV